MFNKLQKIEYQYFIKNNRSIDIRTLEIIEGDLPGRAKNLVTEWAKEHCKELILNWDKAGKPEKLNKIEPLK